MKTSIAMGMPFHPEVCIEKILGRVRAGVTVRRVVAAEPKRQWKEKAAPPWVVVTESTSLPLGEALVEVQYRNGHITSGRAEDFIWHMPARAPGRIARFRVLEEAV